MGIDYGEKRIGIALSNADATVAFPHSVLGSHKKSAHEIGVLAQKNDVEGIVVGESRNLKREKNPVQEKIESFAADLKKEIEVPIVFEDEFYTSQQVERDFGKNAMLDASAAALILQSFLDTTNTS